MTTEDFAEDYDAEQIRLMGEMCIVVDEQDNVIRPGTKKECARIAVQRKLYHELGIHKNQVPLDQLCFLTRIHYLAPSDGLWGEHEGRSMYNVVDHIFIYRGHVDVNANPNEVQATRYVSKQELIELFDTAKEKNIKITPWFRLIVENFLYKWWDNLDSLESMKEESVIHHL
ncbi:isopentenyl-diphosphate delta-isomerase idi1 [Terramyces sp. JEL0728]|nr:isopentenyl-diphosphate delta-isomerase idi1 [Terramyces sp. JEL0728]